MTAKILSVDDLGLPEFAPGAREDGNIFDLSSHERAREALELALSMSEPGFNVFVLGENRSGRLTSTVDFLTEAVESTRSPDDWVYLNNFRQLSVPVAVRLPAGHGRKLRSALQGLVGALTQSLRAAFSGETFQKHMQSEGEGAQTALNTEMKAIQDAARDKGLDILQSEQGHMIVATDDKGEPIPADKMNDEQRALVAEHGPGLAEQIHAVNRKTAEVQTAFQKRAAELGREVAERTCGPLIDAAMAEFADLHGLNRWLVELRSDVIENFQAFLPQPEEGGLPAEYAPGRRYAVNLFVDYPQDAAIPSRCGGEPDI